MIKFFRITLGALIVLGFSITFAWASETDHSPNVARPANAPAASTSADGVWSDLNEATLSASVRAQRTLTPRKYRTLAANLGTLDRLLAQARTRVVVLTLPLPDGTFGKFRIENSALLAPAIAAQFSNLQTWRGYGIDDPTASVALDRTPAGFHALILSAGGTVYVDPYSRTDPSRYISYAKRDYTSPQAALFKDLPALKIPGRAPTTALRYPRAASYGTHLRVYRLAVAATSTYTAKFGNKTNALAAIVTTVNRVAGIYRREFAIDFQLVSGTNVIFDTAASDPFNGKTNTQALEINQTTLDKEIGTANYDVGHVFAATSGGLSIGGSVCNADLKAAAITGKSTPAGDSFDVDMVAHEIGHSFNANHTFNGIVTGDSNCSTSNLTSGTAYEPGAGTTIMSYAGTCDAQNVTEQSDDYFHSASFDEVIAFITNPSQGGMCGTEQITTTNQIPVVTASPNYTIPKQTPFTLTGSATDGDGDALTYTWEEFDLGPTFVSITQTNNSQFGLPNTDGDGNARPVFRSLPPTTLPTRTLPALATILDATQVYSNVGEALPTINRTMQFRLTARDGKGGVANAPSTITVGEAGPFRVTSQNAAGVTWNGNTSQVVTWNVAATNVAPVNCANVNIHLSLDGGNTFTTTLASNAPNTGSAPVTAPNVTTAQARVRVACANNIFFDISRANFAIQETWWIYFFPLVGR